MKKNTKGFGLVELLVVISIISLLATIAISSFNSARVKARDLKRKLNVNQYRKALELYYIDNGFYPATFGYFSNIYYYNNESNNALVPKYIPELMGASEAGRYIYVEANWMNATACSSFGQVPPDWIGIYVRLEDPSDEDLATLTSDHDQCMATTYSMHYRSNR